MAKKKYDSTDLYEVLEVSKRACPEVIESAYRTLMKMYHPDKSPGDDAFAKEINRAKAILLDPEQKAEYDCSRNDLVGKIIGNYRVLEMIAEGGFGKTYKGEHIVLGTPVCIKHGHKVKPQYEKILLEEARAIWDLRHYGIPTMRDILKTEDGAPVIVMSYVPGQTLEQILDKTKKIAPEHVAWITDRCLNVLKYLHYNGVVHGDVKPQNIIVQENHIVTLVDYGLSLIRPSCDTENKGYTPDFASPEQMEGKTLVPESDLYSLGMTMIYSLGGDISKMQVPSRVPDEICNFIKRLIVRDVLSRPNWEKEDLCKTWENIRMKVFGRVNTKMEQIPGI
jgi:serine/threonine protein kinase